MGKSSQIQYGQTIVFVSCILIGLTISTQYWAYKLAYHPYLGDPLFVIFGQGIYAPWSVISWWWKYYDHFSQLSHTTNNIMYISILIAAVSTFILSAIRERDTKSTTYGDASEATYDEIKEAGFFEDRGVIFGRYKKKFLRFLGEYENFMLMGKPRDGKGVGCIVPSVMTWPGSIFLREIRGEGFKATAGWRAKFSHILYFNPIDPNCVHYNPLMEIRRGPMEVSDAQQIADCLVDPEGEKNDNSHWKLASFDFLVGLILHTVYAEEDKSLAGVLNFLSKPGEDQDEILKSILRTKHLGTEVHPVVASIVQSVLNKHKEERSGVISTTLSYLKIFRDPMVADITRKSDFRIRDLMYHDRPVTFYMVIPPGHASRLRPLTQLFNNQYLRLLTEGTVDPENPPYKFPLLSLNDEFHEQGRNKTLQTMAGVSSGYGILIGIIMHGYDQIDELYGPNHSFDSTFATKVLYSTSDRKTARAFSEASGTATVQREQVNFAGHRLAIWLSHKMRAMQETSRLLFTLGQILQLNRQEFLIYRAGTKPIRGTKFRYYLDNFFKKRVLPLPSLGPVDGEYPYRIHHDPDWTDVIAPDPVKEEEKPQPKKKRVNYYELPKKRTGETEASFFYATDIETDNKTFKVKSYWPKSEIVNNRVPEWLLKRKISDLRKKHSLGEDFVIKGMLAFYVVVNGEDFIFLDAKTGEAVEISDFQDFENVDEGVGEQSSFDFNGDVAKEEINVSRNNSESSDDSDMDNLGASYTIKQDGFVI